MSEDFYRRTGPTLNGLYTGATLDIPRLCAAARSRGRSGDVLKVEHFARTIRRTEDQLSEGCHSATEDWTAIAKAVEGR